MMEFSARHVFAAMFGATLLFGQAGWTQSVSISQGDLDAALEACGSDLEPFPTEEELLDPVRSACGSSIGGLVSQLIAANPGVEVSEIIDSAIAAIAGAYNAGSLGAGATKLALSFLANAAEENGAPQAVPAIAIAIASVDAGDPIDIEAVLEAYASPT